MFGFTTLYLAAWLILVPEFTNRILFAMPLFPLYIWLFVLIKQGETRKAGAGLVVGIWIVLFTAALFSGGVMAPGYSGLLIAILASAIFMGRGSALKVAWVSVFAGGAFVLLERIGLSPSPDQFTDSTTMWIAQILYFFIATSLLHMATERITDALKRAKSENVQRRDTEIQLREAEKRYRELVEKVPAVIYSAEPGPEGRWFYVSPRIESLTGFTADEWLERSDLWFAQIHPDDRDAFIIGEAEALAQDRLFQMEYRFIRKDERVIWVRDESLNVTLAESGGTKVVQGFLVDVTERRLAEEKLRTNEVLLSTIIDTIPFDFWVCDDRDRYILQNPISRSIAGDLIGKTLADLDIPTQLREEYQEQHQRVLAGESMRMEETFQQDGETRHTLFIAAPIQDRGVNRGYVGMTIDITEQKRTTEALKETELLYRTLVEQSSVAMYRDHAVMGAPSIFITPQIEKILGYTPEEFCTPPGFWLGTIHPEDFDLAMSSIDEVIVNDRNTSEYRLRSKTGEWVWIRDEARLINDEDSKPLYIQGVLVDITRQKTMEAQRESLIAELEAKNAELERFTYTVSHDLKAPLITMGGFLGYLEKDALSGDIDKLRQDIQRISEANRKMETLLNDLLELSRIGRKMNPPETIPFGQIVSDAFLRAESRLNQKKVDLMVTTDLPLVFGDKNRLVEVVQNLLDNAAKFIGNQTNPVVEIGAETKGDETILFVRDNGIGIDPKFHKKIFELFDKLNPQIEGTGVGLALVKRIIEVHGGRIWVESQPGQGTTFYFTLPSVK